MGNYTTKKYEGRGNCSIDFGLFQNMPCSQYKSVVEKILFTLLGTFSVFGILAYIIYQIAWYYLKNHGAQPIGKYDYLKDIQRMESFSREINNYKTGFTIFLTNDNSYWEKNTKETVDEQFCLNENMIKTGLLKWADSTGDGTKKKREEPIVLNGEYIINWKEYSIVSHNPGGVFKYCLNVIEMI